MEDAEYFNRIIAHSVWDDIRGARDPQFPSTRYSARPAHGRMLPECVYRVGDLLYHSTCCPWTVSSDIVGLGIQIGESFAKPPNAHCVSS